MKVQNEFQFLKWISKAAREGRAWTIWSFLTWAPYHQASFSILLTLKSSKTLSESICVSDSSQPHLLFQVTSSLSTQNAVSPFVPLLFPDVYNALHRLYWALLSDFVLLLWQDQLSSLIPPPSVHVTTTVNTVQNDGLRNGMIDLADKTRAVSLL